MDRWYSDCALSSHYYHLFQISTNQNITVFTTVASKGATLQFSKQLTGVFFYDFNSLCTVINHCQLQLEHDLFVWRWNSNGLFTTHSAYTWMMYRGVVDQNCTIWWALHVLLKIKVFMWLVGKKFFLTRDNLTKRG
jgi:zinc-binding in reverse transcriptase